VTVENRSTGSITNNVDLLAHSGDASVDSNTNGGNATSGDARAELNLVNLINSAIGADQTFFGIFNIYGNLNGDILFPTLGLNGSVASSAPNSSVNNNITGPNSTNNASNSTSNNADITNAAQVTVNNNIDTAAVSGAANVGGNTLAGMTARLLAIPCQRSSAELRRKPRLSYRGRPSGVASSITLWMSRCSSQPRACNSKVRPNP